MRIPEIRDDLKSVGIDSSYLLFSLYLLSGDAIDCFVRNGLIEEAVEAYEKALKLDPSDPRAHNGIGLLLYNRGRCREALYRFTISLDRMPYQVQIRYNRVLALLKLKMVEEARKEIEEIEQLEKGMNMEVSKELRKYLYQIKFGKKLKRTFQTEITIETR